MKQIPWLNIIGINSSDITILPKNLIKSIKDADIVFGAKRHTSLFQNLNDNIKPLEIPFKKTIDKILTMRRQKVILLVSGDPFWYGAGKIISNSLKDNEWVSYPVPSTFSLIASKLGWPIEQIFCIGLHAKSFKSTRHLLHEKAKFIILLKNGNQVLQFSKWLSLEGFGKSKIFIIESIGFKNERIRETSAEKLNFSNIRHPVSIAVEVKGKGFVFPSSTGKDDFIFENDGQISNKQIRAITLSSLSPRPGQHLWDIGSGSGSISIEWLLINNLNYATAIEIKKSRALHIKNTAYKLGLEKLNVIEADAIKVINKLQKPDAVFIGGGFTEELFNCIWNIIPNGTKLVVNSVTLETNAIFSELQKIYGGNLTKIEISNVKKLGTKRSWNYNYPVTQFVLEK